MAIILLELAEALRDHFPAEGQILVRRAIISNPAEKDQTDQKIDIRPIRLRNKTYYQIERFTATQAFHENLLPAETADRIIDFMEEFRQLEIWAEGYKYAYKITKKGKLLSNRQKDDSQPRELKIHNREKKYLLPEGTVIPPLVDLGVFTKEGRIARPMYDKYRQIERFVEMVDEVLPEQGDRPITIVDFGCGKSYLTFILYYYLTQIRHLEVEMTGLDLKEDVIRQCSEIAVRYGYDHLKFLQGDIADYISDKPVDMVISLHACDTATDYALYHAVRWKTKVILSVPCCQHEVNRQMKADALASVTQYGLLKERMAALVTDGLRADLLKAAGYQVQVLEFIDFAHSPKNLLIRARYTGTSNAQALAQAEELIQQLDIHPTLYRLLKEDTRNGTLGIR